MNTTGEQLAIADEAASRPASSAQTAMRLALMVGVLATAATAALAIFSYLRGVNYIEFIAGASMLAFIAGVAALTLGRRVEDRGQKLYHRQINELQSALRSMRNQAARLARERDQLRVEAEAANLAKGEFLATISHEIRTPLNGIIPLLEMLQASGLEGERAEYLGTAYQSSRHLLAIIDNILDYSKIESGKLELEQVGVQIDELLQSVTQLMGKSAERRGVRLETRVDADVRRTYRGDPVRLRQVLTNLVSNAVKFTHEGRVKVTVSKRGETSDTVELLFAVRDTGIGIAAPALREIFEPFSQADASTTRNYGGTGLGLAICKRLVTLMGGDIGVKSEVGRGTVFWFTAPLRKASGDVTGIRDTLEGARALVVSPDSILRTRVERLFGDLGLQASASDSIRDALHQLRSAVAMGSSWALEAVIIDYEALGIKARNMTRAVRNDPQLRSARLIALVSEGASAGLAPNEEIVRVERQCTAHQLHSALEEAFEIRRGDAPAKRMEPDELRFLDPNKHVTTPPTQSSPKKSIVKTAPAEAEALVDRGRVLLVEDNPVNLAVAKKIVGQLGVKIDVARNGQEAVEKSEASAYAAILMDCQMPVMDGYTATKKIREREAASVEPRVPIIAMTANAMSGDRQKCLDAGMDDYLAKPLKPQLIEATLDQWLNSATTTPPPATTGDRDMTLQATAPAIDETVLNELMDIMGAEISDLVAAYLEDAPKLIDSMRAAANEQDTAGLVAPAHTLKSTSANLGAMTLSELAKDIEHQARKGAVSDPSASVQKVEDQYAVVTRELSRLL